MGMGGLNLGRGDPPQYGVAIELVEQKMLDMFL